MTQRCGFTLVELMVSIAIVGLMSMAAIANFRGGARADELRIAAQETVVKIREAQTMAMTGRTANLCQSDEGGEVGGVCVPTIGCATGETCQTLVPRGGYGVYLASASGFILFADGNANHEYDDGEALPGNAFTLPPNVEIASVVPSAPVALIFEPPRGRVFISPAEESLQLTLRHRVIGGAKKIHVDRITGRVEVE
ncbi:MAG: prepilin-type N-terminal cleavage/methylation domain-containing protein [Patescibacteria group bacterium]